LEESILLGNMPARLSHHHDKQNGAPIQYRRVAEAIAAQQQQPPINERKGNHRVVALPMGSLSPTKGQQQPTLYDTSVSSVTQTNSAEDGRSTGSSGGFYYRNSKAQQSGISQQQSPTTPTKGQSQYDSTMRNYSTARQIPQNSYPYGQDKMEDLNMTQSEPGVSIDHDRFSAYINRFAELDPRMDHRSSFEEKKVGGSNLTHHEEQLDKLQRSSKNRLRSRAVYQQQQQKLLNNNGSIDPTSYSHEEIHSTSFRGQRNLPVEASSDIVTKSPSNRTRDLARRFEHHMTTKQQQQPQLQQGRRLELVQVQEDDNAPARQQSKQNAPNYTSTSNYANVEHQTKVSSQPHNYHPQNQLAATYIPIPKSLQKYTDDVDTTYDHQQNYRTTSRTKNPKNDHECDNQRDSVINATSTLRIDQTINQLKNNSPDVKCDQDEIIHSTMPSVERQPRQHVHYRQTQQQQHPEYDHNIEQHQVPSRRQQDNHERSQSLGPPARRRQRPLQAPAPYQIAESMSTDKTTNNFTEHIHDYDVKHDDTLPSIDGEPVIRRVGHRAEIETPSPAKVRELRKKLWTEDELLQVKVRSSFRDVENATKNYYGQRTHLDGPEMAGNSGQRNARSLSPKANRIRNENSNNNITQRHGSARERKGMLFKSRYYEAALRGDMSTSPKRKVNISEENDRKSISPTKKNDVTKLLKEQSVSPTDIRSGSTEDIDTTVAVQWDKSNRKLTEQTSRSRQIDHMTNLATEDDSLKEEYALSLLKKITQVNMNDPQAAIAEINALLSKPQQITKKEVVLTPTLRHSEDLITRESHSVPGVEQANPMVTENESDDDSEGSSVSSMTNPTFQELSNKDNGAMSPSAGHPRPSLLGSCKNSSNTFPTSKKQMMETNLKRSLVKDPANRSPDEKNVDNIYTELQKKVDEEVATSSHAKVDVKKSAVINESPAPSILAQLGSLISPRRIEDRTSQINEIEQKIKMWDDMSTGIISMDAKSPKTKEDYLDLHAISQGKKIKPTNVQDKARRDLPPDNSLKREHPWDASIPVRLGHVSVKDTSMDCGDGVEAQFTPKYAKAHISPSHTCGPTIQQRKEYAMKEKDSPSESTIGVATTHTDQRNNELNNKKELYKNEAQRFVSPQHQQATSMSDDFDSAWVRLPSSKFFAEKSPREQRTMQVSYNNRPDPSINEQLRSHQNVVPVHMDETLSHAGVSPNGEVEVEYFERSTHVQANDLEIEESDLLAPNPPYTQLGSYKRDTYPRHRQASTFDESYNTSNDSKDEEFPTSKSFETAPVRREESKPRSRGLRGFLKRKQADKVGSRSVDKATTAASVSVSVASSRRSDANKASTRPLGDCADVEQSPSNNYSEVVNRYSRRSAKSRSPSRNRARSLDERRIRNPGLAQKFNRLLRVYDHET
jgi:hypothetical protein